MDLRRLGHFLAVADHGGFTRASKAVFVSQPALSLSVRELEEELGAELFYRAGRSVRLTPAGRRLQQKAAARYAAAWAKVTQQLDACQIPAALAVLQTLHAGAANWQ